MMPSLKPSTESVVTIVLMVTTAVIMLGLVVMGVISAAKGIPF